MNSINKTARMAGLLYLIYIVTTIAADVFGRSKLIVFGDAAATARNIMASEWQFRIGITGDLVSAVFFLLAAWALYVLLKPVNKDLALLFLLLDIIMIRLCYLPPFDGAIGDCINHSIFPLLDHVFLKHSDE